jgi:hypothetical protein
MVLGYIATQWGTTTHRFWIMYYALRYCYKVEYNWNLIKRAFKHDLSKFSWIEAKGFSQVILKLKGVTYGTEEYKKYMDKIQTSIKHHYSVNSHHPEYHKNGFLDMTELDKLELIIDWLSAVRRHADGNIFRSLEINQQRFNYNDDEKAKLKNIVLNIKGES